MLKLYVGKLMSFGSYVPSPDLVSLWWRETKGSSKERALEEVGVFEGMGTCNIDIIRRALEVLPDD